MRYWPTKYQLADIFTKGSFTKQSWDQLLDLLQIRVNASEGNASPDRVKQKRPSRAIVNSVNITPESLNQQHKRSFEYDEKTDKYIHIESEQHTKKTKRSGNRHSRTPSPLSR